MTETTCRECGLPAGSKRAAEFCGQKCRMAWHNRRRDRGAELYDLVMAWRFERSRPDMQGHIARLANAYRDADRANRAGRKSWDADARLAKIPLAYSTQGDGR